MTTTPEGKALHDLYREFTETLRYDPSDPDLFERLVSDPRYSRTHPEPAGCEFTQADLDAEYQFGYDAGYSEGRAAALLDAVAALRHNGFAEAAEVLP